MQVNESLLTGESEPVDRRVGDRLLSGSFAVAGSGGYQATGVGAEAYARKLAAQAYPPPQGWAPQDGVPFSSARKWGAASFAGHGAWVLGAPEMVLPRSQDGLLSRAADLAASGRRVLALAHAPGSLNGQALPPGLRAVAFITLTELLRSDAPDTIAYFAAQGVALKVISGDSPHTVGAVAKRTGVPRAATPSTRGTYRRTPARSAPYSRNDPSSAG